MSLFDFKRDCLESLTLDELKREYVDVDSMVTILASCIESQELVLNKFQELCKTLNENKMFELLNEVSQAAVKLEKHRNETRMDKHNYRRERANLTAWINIKEKKS